MLASHRLQIITLASLLFSLSGSGHSSSWIGHRYAIGVSVVVVHHIYLFLALSVALEARRRRFPLTHRPIPSFFQRRAPSLPPDCLVFLRVGSAVHLLVYLSNLGCITFCYFADA